MKVPLFFTSRPLTSLLAFVYEASVYSYPVLESRTALAPDSYRKRAFEKPPSGAFDIQDEIDLLCSQKSPDAPFMARISVKIAFRVKDFPLACGRCG
jgi:hypothetical protein